MAPTQGFPQREPDDLMLNQSGAELPEFSLVTGGPLFLIFRKSHLSGEALEHIYRRVIIVTLLTWLPLLLLASTEKEGVVLFLKDVEVHARLLVALPSLIAGELLVHSWIRSVVRAFVNRRLISSSDIPRFHEAMESAMRLRNSPAISIAILIVVYTVGPWIWGNRVSIGIATWYALPGGRWRLTAAGYWYVFVSIPLVQFLLLSWYMRFFNWCRFLWRVSRIKLNLIATHPDHRAGLGFLGRSAYAFSPVLFAQGAMLAGVVASRVLHRGEALMSFKLQILGFDVLFVLAVLGPLLVFSPQIAMAKTKGLAIYGRLGQTYVENFERKWIDEGPPPVGDLLGTSDIQTLADLSNSYSIVSAMRIFPFGLEDISRLAVTTAAPFAPLLLTVFSLEELVMRIIRVLF